MPLALSCSCGARFEVEETFAGQTVSCPECQAGVEAPALARHTVRTSGLAIASVVLALVLACTGIGTLVAALLGGIALGNIRRSRGQLAGTGYAAFGIVMGLVFTGVFGVLLFKGDLFGAGNVREYLMGEQLDRSGPLEIVREKDGFAITRPSQRWGIVKGKLAAEQRAGSSLFLGNLDKDVWVDVTIEPRRGRTLRQIMDSEESMFRLAGNARGQNVQARQTNRWDLGADREALEEVLDIRIITPPQPLTFIVRVIGSKEAPARFGWEGDDPVFILRGWAWKRGFPAAEPGLRQVLNSFRVLAKD